VRPSAPARLEVVGREVELAGLDRFLTTEGGARALVLVGDPGIGKTTLWEAGASLAHEHGRRVLTARATEPEEKLSFVAVADVLEEVESAELARMPGPQLRALEVAVLRAEPGDSPPDLFAVAAGFTAALRLLSSRGPLLVALDDVPWLDRSSAEALTFAARRLGGRRVRFLLARRPGRPSPLEKAFGPVGIERVELGTLSFGATRALLAERLGLSLPRRVLRRVFESSGGNPLLALELGRLLVERGTPEIGDELPLPDLVDDLFAERIAGLAGPVRLALLAVALAGSLTRRQLVTIADPLAVEDAAASGLLVVDGSRVRASHPLLAAAARRHSSAAERRALHLELAQTAVDDTLRASHRALATARPDEDLAATVAEAAAVAVARGAAEDAAELAEHAFRLTPPEAAERAGRLLDLAEYLSIAGERQRVTELLGPELKSLPPGAARVRACLILTDGAIRDNGDIRRYLELAFAESHDDDRLRAAVLAELASNAAGARVEGIEQAEGRAGEALALARSAGTDVERLALHALAWARGLRGRPVDDLCELFDAAAGIHVPMSAHPARVRVQRLVWRGEVEAARDALAAVESIAVDRGEVLSQGLHRLHLCELELRVGRFGVVARLVDEWGDRSEREILPWPMYERCRALLAAGRGLPEAERLADDALARAEETGVRWDWLEAQRAGGLAALLAHDAARAADSLGAVWQHTREEGVEEPGVFPVAPDLVEALVELGELEEAEEVTDRLERLSVEQEHPWGKASVKRCRGLIGLAQRGYEDRSAALLVEAVEAYGALGLRFDEARSLLVAGRAQRRFRKWATARRSLGLAAAAFQELGAFGWENQARAELERVGARRPAPDGALTAAEERVARLAASGLSNKQIAAELFVSVYTVEKHLTHVYAKVGVRSRSQLAHRLNALA
jgi:DNA-binding CsgD family transcriptional regulator